MSAIYRAFDTVMGREVALKRLLPVEETNLNEASTGSLAREAAALARFSHPNVVTVFAFEEDAEGPFVVMELVEGEDLHSIMKSGALSWEDFRDVAEQCLEPLVAAGELNLLHRDIKPGNIMLTVTASGRFLVKLLDFGLAKFSQQPSLQTLDQRGSFLGSIDFIAPEQLELRPLDQRTDLYSLGCVFYYMLAQQSPFTGGNPAETTMNHVKHRCQPIGERRPDLPPLVADWIMRLVARYPEDRPADAREALKQFHEALKGIPYQPEDEVPFARIAGDPPSDPPAVVVEAGKDGTDNPSPTRVLRTASGPIPAGKRGTGPVAGSQLPRSQTTRQVRVPPPGTGPLGGVKSDPQKARPAGAWRPATRGGSEKPPGGNARAAWRWIAASAGGVIALLAVGLFFRDADDPEAGSGAVAVDRDGGKPPAFTPLAYPGQLPTTDGKPDPPPLPIVDGLFAHFVSAKGVYGRDYRRPAERDAQVAAWVNLANPKKERCLLRDGGDGKGEHLPILGIYGGNEIAGLIGSVPGVTTTNRTSLTMLKHQGALPRGFTLVAVMRIEAGDDRLFRILPPVADGRAVSLATGYDGKISAIHRGKAEGPDVRISVPWKSGESGVLAYVWNPPGAEHRLLARPVSAAPVEARGPIEFSGSPLGTVAIGRRGFGDSFDTRTGNVYFEFVVYDRVLEEAEIEKLAGDLAGRYFAKGG